MLRLSSLVLLESKKDLSLLPEGKFLVNTINAHSFNTAQNDELFAQALSQGDYLLPDGASIVMACRWLKGKTKPKERIAGFDLFTYEMKRLNDDNGPTNFPQIEENGNVNVNVKKKVMFMGSSEFVLGKIKERAAVDYPNLEVVTYSPPYKVKFSDEDNEEIIKVINETKPDLLWIGMTAPKQEKWTWEHWKELDINCHVGTIGAVFDFYAGTMERAPLWMQQHSLEWLYRLLKEPRRMWRRYLIGNPVFLWNIMKEKVKT